METQEDAADFCFWQPGRIRLAGRAWLLPIVTLTGGKQQHCMAECVALGHAFPG